ncbi:MAG: hypothetical protein KF857_02545 [Fimbriimonadaceae bacterium]|nr:hypothetical protein [Fimbriimonadaceae bacterium]
MAPILAVVLSAYDPMAVPAGFKAKTVDLVVHDTRRDRDIPVYVYLPATAGKAPVVLCSHGLGGTRFMASYLGRHWSARGYVVVFTQHPGSDDSVWRGLPPREVMPAMKKAASGENFTLRVADIPAVLDQLTAWDKQPGHPLEGRLDMARVGMSGHSFGAVTTQAVSGQSFGAAGQRYTDPRILAACAFSPSSPRSGAVGPAFGSVKVPWMLMTGTEDVSPIGDQTVETREKVYPALPATIDRYEVVLDGARHSAFTDRALPGEGSRNPAHHRAILALSTAFWDAYLKGDKAAKAWLTGPGAKSILGKADRWQSATAKG